jgi:hypothetical protein
MALGLALYDKEQEFVNEGSQRQEKRNDSVEQVNASSNGQNGSSSKNTRTPVNTVIPETTKPKTGQAKAIIKAAFDVLKEQKKITADDFRKKYLDGAKVDQLTEEQAQNVLTGIKTDFKELGL